jgi:nucleoside diphosphate kinase
MVNEYHCSEHEINHFKSLNLTKSQLKRLNELTFIIISNETFKLNLLGKVLNQLFNIGAEFIEFQLKPRLDEHTLIELYKYHHPQPLQRKYPSVQFDGYGNSVPSVGWPVVRKRFSKPLLACVIRGKQEDFLKVVLETKGVMRPSLCGPNQIRRDAPNTALNLLHSSDDLYSVLRESLLFFGQTRMLELLAEDDEALNKRKERNHTLLMLKSKLYRSTIRDSDHVLNSTKYKILWHLASLFERDDEVSRMIDLLEKFSDNLQEVEAHQNELREFICYSSMKDHELALLFHSLNDSTIPSVYDIGNAVKISEKYGLADDEWEQLLIESHIVEKYWVR